MYEYRKTSCGLLRWLKVMANALEVDYWGGHEAQQKYKQRKTSGEAAIGVEGSVVVNGGGAKKAEAEEQGGPDVPAGPVAEEAEEEQQRGQKCRDQTMSASAEGTKNVAAVELSRRQKI